MNYSGLTLHFRATTIFKNLIETVAQGVGFFPIIKKALKQKVDKSKSLVFDEMSFKTNLHYNVQIGCVDRWESKEGDGLKELST